VEKEVVCAPEAPGTCATATGYGESATGVQGAGFCYRITVRNCSDPVTGDVLNNVTVSDPDIPGVAGAFPTTLTIGQTVERFFSKTWPVGTHVNTVTASGVGASSGTRVEATDTATAIVVPIGVECETLVTSTFDEDGRIDNCVDLAADSTTTVHLALTVRNTGQANLSVAITGTPCGEIPATVIPAGESRVFECDVDVACPTSITFPVSVIGTAVAGNGVECVFTSEGRAITTGPASCLGCVTCRQPVTCRVTGGGVLIDGFESGIESDRCTIAVTELFPKSSGGIPLNKVTHGGQLGAPFSQMDCPPGPLGNPCIRGQWQHTRHYVGKGNPREVFDMNFHSNTPKGVFDTLHCACLGCCDPETGEFNEGVLGPLIKKFALCNPDDRKMCGPLPRPAPANAIIFTGIGRLSPASDTGVDQKRAEYVVFRVYIEDRSEPGGGHPGGAVEPADIYCFQAWKTGVLVQRRPDFSGVAVDFRRALQADSCAFLDDLDTGARKIGSLPDPDFAPGPKGQLSADVSDCGPMHTGNHQIHPSTGATCTETP
jgi:hypothetical protein